MFDKFIESNSEADQHPRRTYFLVSTIVVGMLFVTGVIASIYAQEIGLGTDEFELSSILAPIPPVDAPEPPRPTEQQQTSPDRIVRQANILRMDEQPIIPATTSVVPNTHAARPPVPFDIGRFDTPSFATSTPSGQSSPIGSTGPGTPSRPSDSEVAENESPVEPPVIKVKPPTMISKGVVNGMAIELPKPIYPRPAKTIGAVGDVTVQVLIDERGVVVSAKALKGHPLLLQESERAAKRARFKPTLLSDIPVKVTGVITYKFTR